MNIKITPVLLTFLTFIFSCFEINAQSSCDINGPSSGNYTFQSNKKVCFYNNSTLGDVIFQNGTKIYIAPNVTVIIQNNVTSSGTIDMEIDGTLQFTQSVTIDANVDLNIGTKGILKAGNTGQTDFKLNGSGTNTVTNNGQFNVGVLGLQHPSGTYTFDSSSNAIINIHSNINIGGKSFFRNQGKLLIGNSYNCNSKSVFVNCGEMVSSAGFNLGGGKVINTGKFTVSSSRIDFGSSTARFENYGSVNVQGSMNLGGSGCVYYNEGTTVVSDNFQNDGNIEGPAVGSGKLGYITWKGKAAMNSGKIGPNLNLKNSSGTSSTSGMFNNPNSMNFLSGVVYNCSNCPAPQVNSGVICREPDGSNPDIDETCNVYTTVLAEPTTDLVKSLNDTGKGLFPVKPSGPAFLPNGGVKVEVIKNFTTSHDQWRLYQPTAQEGIINIKGVPTKFKTKYLDLIGAYTNPKVLERTIKLDYEVTSKSLNTTTHAYRYIIGIAGLSDNNVAGKVTSSVPLEVIGNMDAYQTGKYSYFNNTTPPIAGDRGTVFESNPKTPSSRPSNELTNGYTFFYLPDDISSFELETKGNDQYGFIFGTLTTTISPTPDAPTSGGNQTICWNGNANHTLTATATAPQGQIVTWYETATGGSPIASPTQVGVGTKTYYAQSSNLNGTCSSLTRTAVTLTVNATPAAPISGGNQTICSDGTTNQTLTATATVPQGQTITWYTQETGGTPTSPTQVGVGSKTYYAQASNGTCTSLTRTAVTLTIYPKAGVPNADNVEYCAGDTAQALTATASNPDYTLYYYDSLTSAPQSSIIPITTNAGEFTYYVAEGINNSCIGDKKAITVIVHPKSVITTEPINQSITYGDNTSFTVSATNVTSYQWQVNTGSGFTNIINDDIYSNTTTATLTLTKPTVAMSSYTYRAILIGRCTNTETSTVNLTVTPKAVTITADDKTKVYGDENPVLTAVVTGAVNNDVINYSLSTTATQFSPVDTYPIVVTLGENPNYIVTKVDGTLTVTPKELNVVVTADNKTKVYGDENPVLTAVVTGAVNNDVINYSLSTTATQFSPVATYPITVALGENPNYIVTKVDGTLTVTPKELNVVVTADNKTKVYGDENPVLTAVVTGAVNNDVINYSLSTTATQFSPVATYPITVALGENPNYIVT
ncbi:MBG domain-containing protein, partial [Flavobacterium sp. ST-87]